MKYFLYCALIIVLVWLTGFYLSTTDWIKTVSDQPVSDVFNSLNTLFAGLAFAGLIITILVQKKELELQRQELILTREELRKSSEANLQIAIENKEKSIFDLYLTFSDDSFEEIRVSSWRVLENCLRSTDYCSYVVNSFFVTGTKDFKRIEDFLEQTYGEIDSPIESIHDRERADRIKLDMLINFFSLLANKDAPQSVLMKFNFYYGWWRPVLWWVLFLGETAYQSTPEVKMYSVRPDWIRMLSILDNCYGFTPFTDLASIWHHLQTHPRMKRIAIDPRFEEMIGG
ncbi:MAG: hypothetical protein AAF433_02335 [Bacteroidota bacterium]